MKKTMEKTMHEVEVKHLQPKVTTVTVDSYKYSKVWCFKNQSDADEFQKRTRMGYKQTMTVLEKCPDSFPFCVIFYNNGVECKLYDDTEQLCARGCLGFWAESRNITVMLYAADTETAVQNAAREIQRFLAEHHPNLPVNEMTFNRRYYFDEDYFWVNEPYYDNQPQLTPYYIETYLTEIPKKVEQYLNPVEEQPELYEPSLKDVAEQIAPEDDGQINN